MTNLYLLNNKLLVEPINLKASLNIHNGLIRGIVRYAGPGMLNQLGRFNSPAVSIGDTILFTEQAIASRALYNSEEFLLLEATDLIGIEQEVEEEE